MVSEHITGSMLTVTDVAKMLHAHSNVIKRWADRGVITSYRINHRGDCRFRYEDIMSFFAEMNTNHGVPPQSDSAS
jgi:excisionase family DNA binding protein